MMQIRPATVDDARYIGRNLRDDDEREAYTSRGLPGAAVVPAAFGASRLCSTVTHNEEPVGIFGVCGDPSLMRRGVVWMLCTNGIHRCSLQFLKAAPEILDGFSKDYLDGLHVYIDARNTTHLRWCLRLGFRIAGHAYLNGQRFLYIHRKAQRV